MLRHRRPPIHTHAALSLVPMRQCSLGHASGHPDAPNAATAAPSKQGGRACSCRAAGGAHRASRLPSLPPRCQRKPAPLQCVQGSSWCVRRRRRCRRRRRRRRRPAAAAPSLRLLAASHACPRSRCGCGCSARWRGRRCSRICSGAAVGRAKLGGGAPRTRSSVVGVGESAPDYRPAELCRAGAARAGFRTNRATRVDFIRACISAKLPSPCIPRHASAPCSARPGTQGDAERLTGQLACVPQACVPVFAVPALDACAGLLVAALVDSHQQPQKLQWAPPTAPHNKAPVEAALWNRGACQAPQRSGPQRRPPRRPFNQARCHPNSLGCSSVPGIKPP
jgi:hypothetical protein